MIVSTLLSTPKLAPSASMAAHAVIKSIAGIAPPTTTVVRAEAPLAVLEPAASAKVVRPGGGEAPRVAARMAEAERTAAATTASVLTIRRTEATASSPLVRTSDSGPSYARGVSSQSAFSWSSEAGPW